jgi:hypothetical protein
MKKSRAPDLTTERIQMVIDTLDNWEGKLTWDLLIAAVAKTTCITYSRFTFAEYPQVANAFSMKKEALRGKWAEKPTVPRDARVKAALEQAGRFKSKARRLEKENQLLLEQFVTWAFNAERKGVTVAMLNAPLPKPHRARSKGVK